MKSFDDELNDAIQKALHDSFENFERKPGASIDQKIYEALDKPTRVRPLLLSAAAVLLLLLGFGVKEMNERYASLRAITRSRATNEELKEGTNVVPLHGSIVVSADQPSHTHRSAHANPAKPNVRRPLRTATPAKPASILHEHAKPVPYKVKAGAGPVLPAENNTLPVMETEPALPVQIQDNAVASRAIDANEIATGRLVPLPVDLAMPEISFDANVEDSTLLEPEPRPVREKLDFPRYQPSDKKSFAWIFNLSATNTFQSIYLLPNAESRILKVSFPVSTANLGYKFSAGFQTLGLQWLFHYSHLSWKAEYIYAIDEFKADEQGANRYVFERLGKAETVTSKVELAGVGIKKQFDFKGKRSGRFFAQIGADYSRQLQSSGRNFLTGSISAGKIFTVNKTTDFIVGPYFEYNFNKVPTAEYSIKVRPNQVGLSLGLRMNRTK
ncbi:hypothetical protein J2Y45_006109 [Dyadobacter sp. BE34]|uniref:Outer membrane protein beta-barrel domain-containing protein n=1 Tax=Dyadobacter fermentans TaxID=94254 RepID=A0ABU1R7I0_9BACT|nr:MULTISPECIES: hypothetical protein [Dyadobacter]MDR6808895.1 hypothetical protein [Dyadobacter fermentans]MDR7046638.1 hypothetical protein [Dyadobacter sp. BE242]MDR7200952.1 hypothetical protein [Dyadobacter sp. BE34]MDR7218912.1 hypothetical protein [Dyadobacter sp. BE31]MDR7264878.1 hypothetical protein [Dyadobacter sp. BE32]